MVFSAENIVKRYANHTALHKVSIDVPKNSIFGLLGPNGAGKTTLIRIINQIIGPDFGELYMNGKPLSSSNITEIGYLPEERGLYKKMKVGEQAIYLARLKGMSKTDAIRELKFWFAKFEIEAWWGKKIEELSKGMAQKIQFITTVIHKPSLLILDEPFSGFDPINTMIVKKEILRMRDEGTSIILSTHNMESVEEICDHIALINKAEKILSGKVTDIINEYRSFVYEVVFKGNLIALTNALWTGCELLDNKKLDNDVIKATIKLSDKSTVNGVLQNILPHVELISINEIVPTMNDIFIRAVNEQNNKTNG